MTELLLISVSDRGDEGRLPSFRRFTMALNGGMTPLKHGHQGRPAQQSGKIPDLCGIVHQLNVNTKFNIKYKEN